MARVIVTGPFDQLDCRQVRFLQEASKLGEVVALVWSDTLAAQITSRPCKFPQQERLYVLERIRYVKEVVLVEDLDQPHALPGLRDLKAQIWAIEASQDHPLKRRFCQDNGLELALISDDQLSGLPLPPVSPPSGRQKVVVTGCFDWLHSGHIRFFEQASDYGDLYVVVGSDANVRQLKGPGHPLFSQKPRQYMVSAVRFVKQALISTGSGWLDADPQIRQIRPDIYIVNEDGDKGGKRQYCEEMGIRYIVLNRTPAPGLPRRTSTELRGF
ncbi:MAG: adenylyltransferase/cytidyltransferase family protein [Sedimentisphaerales bacterium]|nr:adenylyltransferase/cytidyltransferase family protein [Sedimentisphaerales bacterium]